MLISNILNASLIFAAILLVAALSGLISEKAGIVNIAINGLMIIGALSYVVFGALFDGFENRWTIWFAILLAGLVTALFSTLHGFATIVLKADHVVSGTAINLFTAGIGVFITPILSQKLLDSPDFKNQYLWLNFKGSALNPQTIIFIGIAIFIAITMFIYFRYTKFGLRHAAVGENPNAADSAAIKVNKYKWTAVMISGFLAGISGAFATYQFNGFKGNVQGLGFVALAIMILGQWKISLIIPSTILFSIIWGYVAYNSSLFGLPTGIVRMIPFILSLISLVFMSKFQSPPKAVGEHFDKSKR